jgi:hypothetical protein
MSAALEPTTPSIDEIVDLKATRALDERALRTLFLEARAPPTAFCRVQSRTA